MTLEWILIFGAVAGLAASSVLIVQRVLDDTSELPADPATRVIDADIAAAFLATEANAAALDAAVSGTTYDAAADAPFRTRCETDLESAFRDVLDDVTPRPPQWTPPVADSAANPPEITTHAQCRLTVKPGLGN